MKLVPSIIGAAATALCSVPAQAQAPVPTEAPTQALTRDELARALERRDAVIAALQARVAALEQAQATRTAQVLPAAEPGAIPAASAASASAPSAVSATSAQDDEALQALSRTLVQRGGLLLPAWHMELIPSAAYSNRVVQGLALVQTPEGIPTVADQRLREDRLRGTMALRLGLPWSSQIEVRVPYNWLRTSRALGDGTFAANQGHGIGDVEIALSHQFFQDKGWHPAVVGGLTWRSNTGQDPFRIAVASVATGSGANEFEVHVTALKSSDPLVFFGTLSYAHDLSVHESFGTVQMGDAMGLDLGLVLSLNLDTAMTFGLSQQFRRRTFVDDHALPGTDTIASSFQLGLSRVLSPRLLLDLSLGVGLTHDAPDYVFQVSLPFQIR